MPPKPKAKTSLSREQQQVLHQLWIERGGLPAPSETREIEELIEEMGGGSFKDVKAACARYSTKELPADGAMSSKRTSLDSHFSPGNRQKRAGSELVSPIPKRNGVMSPPSLSARRDQANTSIDSITGNRFGSTVGGMRPIDEDDLDMDDWTKLGHESGRGISQQNQLPTPGSSTQGLASAHHGNITPQMGDPLLTPRQVLQDTTALDIGVLRKRL
ncbi:hypothetical protein BJ508DRAFT_332903 [Ascobolus immersus RN42]|uniref:Uncharacterized protein n=1 Tax=Ascobolus immersus RN42 TaxID=1160509 RepID=A0A3N4HNT9_ASCIM|nr:hypothetical protein BJ508DRAFT_332903 [Ascobolus immersus RN42]